jgi:hypothetical protein
MSSESTTKSLLQAHKDLQEELCSNKHNWDEQLEIIRQMNQLSNELMCEEYPHLIPVRMGNKKLVKIVMKKVSKNKK